METHWVEMYLNFLRVEKNVAANTVAAYSSDLTQFLDHIRHLGRNSFLEVTRADIQGFIDQLHEDQRSSSTVARKLSAIKSFFAFLNSDGLSGRDPASSFGSISVTKQLPSPLNADELTQLRAQSSKGVGPEARRNHLIIELILGNGLKITELIGLNVADVDLDSEPVKLNLKRRDQAVVLELTEELGLEMRGYSRHIRPRLSHRPRETALFLNRRGERLTRQGCWLIIQQVGRAAGIESSRATPANLRHTFAVNSLRSGASVVQVQEALGHAAKSTTAHYYQELVTS